MANLALVGQQRETEIVAACSPPNGSAAPITYLVSALFVALNIADAGTMPDIDPTYVTLMEISNGVYITTKFVRA